MNNIKSLVIEALKNVGYELFDGRFIKDLRDASYITIAFNDNAKSPDDVQISKGDWLGYYANHYKRVFIVGEYSDLDKIFDYLERS